jgi:hypothetical protein
MSLVDRLRWKDPADDHQPPEVDEDTLRPEELHPVAGGTWRGLLFDNPNIGLSPGLTWTFEFPFAEVSRDYGTSEVGLTVDWVPLPGAAWSTMAGRKAAGEVFGEPIECSAYFFEHYRYDVVQLRILEQVGSRLRVAVEAQVDLDGLGIPSWDAEQWLDFEGLSVQLDGVTTVDDATAQLAEFTDAAGLVAVDNGHNVRFVEPSESAS